MTVITTTYGANTTITMDLSALASSATFVAGRESSQIDNASNYLSNLSGLISDAHSAAVVAQALNASDMSDLRSAINAVTATVSASDISDIASAVWATALATKLVQLNPSDLSDIRSAISAGPGATVTASDISDIASAVKAILASDLSDILSAAVQTNSRTLVVQSQTSDIYSLLSDVSSDLGVMSGVLSDTLSSVQAAGIRKKTAYNDFEFLMVDSTDHVTPKTGLTVTGQRSIDGGVFAAVGGVIAEGSAGIYQFDAAAADTNGDSITWKFTGVGADATYFSFKTIP